MDRPTNRPEQDRKRGDLDRHRERQLPGQQLRTEAPLPALATDECPRQGTHDFTRRQADRLCVGWCYLCAAARDERLSRLDRAIAGLPALYKEPLLLTVAGGLSHAETAALLKTTPKAIEMRLARARRKLLEAMQEKD